MSKAVIVKLAAQIVAITLHLRKADQHLAEVMFLEQHKGDMEVIGKEEVAEARKAGDL